MEKYTELADQSRKRIIEKSLKELEFDGVLKKVASFAISEMGKEIILSSRPSEELFWLRKEHSQISEIIEVLINEDQIPLEGLGDIRPKLHKSRIENAVLSASEIMLVYDNIRVFRLIRNYFEKKEENYPNLWEEADKLTESRLLEKHINDAIDDTGEIRDNATKDLQNIRRSIHDKSARLRSRLQKILRKVSDEEMVMEEFVTLREGRFVLPVKSEHKKHLPGIIHGLSQTGSTVFIEPSEIIETNNELSLLFNEEKREMYRILSNLTSEIGEKSSGFLSSMEIMGHLDSIIARGKYALEYGGVKPEILEENYIFLKEIRHPLLVHTKGNKKVIPLSIEFNGDERGHLISGPNAGGKTVALKSIGLNVAMALSGIFPLGECKAGFRFIYSSIGDHQSIENDLSTFSSQIIQLKEILDNCTKDSLVLIDEIGSGTDPQEGAALAAGILDTFLEIGLFFVATTHQSSLKTYALNRDEIVNASLEFNEQRLQPTYKFLSGIPGNSYAFFLAQNLGLSELVIQRSKKYLGSKQKELEESINILQKYRTEAEQLRNNADKQRLHYEKERKKFEEKNKEIKSRRKEYIEEAQRSAGDIVSSANSLIENTIKEIQEQKRSFVEIKSDYENRKKEIQKAVKPKPKETPPPISTDDYNVGDFVMMDNSNSVGTVLEINQSEKSARVEFNGMKFTLPLKRLYKTKPEKSKKADYADHISFDVNTKLDLRGKRAEESIQLVDEFISDAIMNNVDHLTIIHGKGTGALRKVVHEYLSHHHQIESFRLGDLVEGGSGVTIVKI